MVLKVRGLNVIIMLPLLEMEESQERETKIAFGIRVRECRKKKNLSQENLALACGLDRTYIGGVERGERNISLINIHKIAFALGVSPGDLVG